jgi:hypothetical protein
MFTHPADFDATRAWIADAGLVAQASMYLTEDVALRLPPEDLPDFKTLLKRFFSEAPWGNEDDEAMAALVTRHVGTEWWEHDLGDGITLSYGNRDGQFALSATGGKRSAASIFDRAFDGPVTPEATPHPRKVRFSFGGTPAPGEWFKRGDPIEDAKLSQLFAEPDVTDVMVAGDFVTVGIDRSWEDRLEPLLALVTDLYGSQEPAVDPERTRAELLSEAGQARAPSEELHMLDPDDPAHRARLQAALGDASPAVRRIAVAILAESSDREVRNGAIERGLEDASLRVRRMALDAAGDTGDDAYRSTFERAALGDPDAWMRWRAVKALGELGVGSSRVEIESALDDDEFRVRFEAERVLRSGSQDTGRKTQG